MPSKAEASRAKPPNVALPDHERGKKHAHSAPVQAGDAKRPRISPAKPGADEISGKGEAFADAAAARHGELTRTLAAKQELLVRKSAEVQAARSALDLVLYPLSFSEGKATLEVKRLEEALVAAKREVGMRSTDASKVRTWFGVCRRRRQLEEAVTQFSMAAADVKKLEEAIAQFPTAARTRARELTGYEASLSAREQEQESCKRDIETSSRELIDHEAWMSGENLMRFNSKTAECAICRDDVAVGAAVLLGCGHGFYCSQCITKFVDTRLSNGLAGDVPCPDCSSAIPDKDLTKLLPEKTISCLHTRSREQEAVASGGIQRACPTPNCSMRQVLKEGSSGMILCLKCNVESCWLCGAQPFHDGRTCEQHAMRERNRGLRKDEDSIYEWMEATGTRQCPKCQMGVSKENIQRQTEQRSECHKMFCRNCGTRFCFKCLAVLSDTYTCGCSKNKHGFIDPYSGAVLGHLKRGQPKRSKASLSGA